MPSSTRKQHNFMEAVAHGMTPRKGGPSKAVASEFVQADKSAGKFKPNGHPGRMERLKGAK